MVQTKNLKQSKLDRAQSKYRENKTVTFSEDDIASKKDTDLGFQYDLDLRSLPIDIQENNDNFYTEILTVEKVLNALKSARKYGAISGKNVAKNSPIISKSEKESQRFQEQEEMLKLYTRVYDLK